MDCLVRFGLARATKNSPVYLLVVFEPEMKVFNNFMDLCFFLEDLFGWKVNVVTPESLSSIFGHKILEEVKSITL